VEPDILNGKRPAVGPVDRAGPLLEPVGLGQPDTDVYLDLLARPRSTPADLAASLDLPIGRVRRTLQRLLDVGLATRLVASPHRYVAAPPEVAVDALVLRRQQQLEQLRADVRELALRLQPGSPPAESSELVGLVDGRDAVEHHLARMQLGAVEEVLIIDAPPYLYGHPVQNHEELRALERGVRYRCLYHAPGLEEPGHLNQVLHCVAAGEQARSLPSVRMKMIIVDHRLALLPLSFSAAETGNRILVHVSPLLDALVLCFESLWSRATPIAASQSAPSADGDRRLLSLLSSGMKDRAIARALGVTERTVSRRISELMADLDVTTRFQAGVQAARRGWL